MWSIATPSPLLAGWRVVDDLHHGVQGLSTGGARLVRVAFDALIGVLLVHHGHLSPLIQSEPAIRTASAAAVLLESSQPALEAHGRSSGQRITMVLCLPQVSHHSSSASSTQTTS